MKNLITRTLTGILFVGILVGCIVGGETAFFALFGIITVLASLEFAYNINIHSPANANPIICAVGAVLVFWSCFETNMGEIDGRSILLLVSPYLIVLLVLFVYELFRKTDTPIQNLALTVFAHLYTGLPFGLLSALAYHSDISANGYDYAIPLAVFIFLWTNDTGAYCVGSLLHKRLPAKLSPNISPKKTWVGTIGGGVLCLVAAAVLSEYFGRLTLTVWLGFGLVVCIFGTLGDLVESLIKRKLGVKDSGNILPGHGGILDRFDSSLLAIPATATYFGIIEAISRL